MDTITIIMKDGLIQGVEGPRGNKVIVKDYDTDFVDDDEIKRDANGALYHSSEWII